MVGASHFTRGYRGDDVPVREALQKLLRSPSALSRARLSLAYLPDMSRDSLHGFAHLGLLATLLQSFLRIRTPTLGSALR